MVRKLYNFIGVYYYFYELTKTAITSTINNKPDLSVGESMLAGAVAGKMIYHNIFYRFSYRICYKSNLGCQYKNSNR